MRTIEGPLKPTAKVYRLRCRYKDCAALLEVTRDELTRRSGRYKDVLYSFDCPHCHGVTFIEPEELKTLKVYPPLG